MPKKKNNPYAIPGKTMTIRKKVTGALLSMSFMERLSYRKYTMESLESFLNKDKSPKMSELNATELAERLTPQSLISIEDYSKLLGNFDKAMLEIYQEKNPLVPSRAKSKELHQVYLGDSSTFELEYPEGMNPKNINCSLDEFAVSYTIEGMPFKVIFKLASSADSGIITGTHGYEFRNLFSAAFVSENYKKCRGQKREELKFLNFEFAVVTTVDSASEHINFDNAFVACRNLPVFVYECRKLNVVSIPSFSKEYFADIVCRMFFNALDTLENVPVIEGEHLARIEGDPDYIHEELKPGHEVDLLSRDYDDSEGAKKTRAYTRTCEKWYVRDYYRKGKLVHGYCKGPKRNDPNIKPVVKTYVKV